MENELIDKVIKFLEGLKRQKSEVKPFDVRLSHALINTTARIDSKRGRITIASSSGQTSTNLHNRKIETIEGLARCMLEAVDIARGVKK